MIQVIGRALDMLEIISREAGRPVPLSEIVAQLKLHPATSANILRTLVDRGYLEQPERKKGYRLGPASYQLTAGSFYRQDLVAAARAPLQQLTTETGENSLLAVLSKDERLILWAEDADRDLQVRGRPRKPRYETATGRLLLAYLPEAEQATVIARLGVPPASAWPEAAGSQAVLRRALAGIREQECASQLTREHVVGLAVPLRRAGEVVAALGMYLPDVRAPRKRQTELLQALRAAAAATEARLG